VERERERERKRERGQEKKKEKSNKMIEVVYGFEDTALWGDGLYVPLRLRMPSITPMPCCHRECRYGRVCG
jgi:hypothetical protein